MRIAICENNKGMLENVYQKTIQYEFKEEVKIEKYLDGEALLRAVKENANESYDVIIMDICLIDTEDGRCHETADGIEAAKKIKNITPDSLVIYMSAYSAFYGDLAQAEPFAFLRKPIITEELHRVLNNCQIRRNRLRYKFYNYKFKGENIKVNLNDVVFFYSHLRTVRVQLKDGSERYFYGKLDIVEEELSEIGAFFIRINKSYIINKIYVENTLLHNVIIFGKELAVTEKYQDNYNIYIGSERYF